MNKHTPGPWTFERVDTGYTINSKHRYIADAHNWTIIDTGEESEANAHLIAAAPDLLSAVIEFRALFTDKKAGIQFRGNDGMDVMERMRKVFEKMEMAFRKAEGRG